MFSAGVYRLSGWLEQAVATITPSRLRQFFYKNIEYDGEFYESNQK